MEHIGILGGRIEASTINHYLRISRKNVLQYGNSTYSKLLSAASFQQSLDWQDLACASQRKGHSVNVSWPVLES